MILILFHCRENLFEDLSLICNYNRKLGRGRNFSSGNETVGNIKKVLQVFTCLKCSDRYKGISALCVEMAKIYYDNDLWRASLNKHFFQASLVMSQVLSLCRWKGKQRACDGIFTPILTEDGICFTFNTIGPEDLLRLEKYVLRTFYTCLL